MFLQLFENVILTKYGFYAFVLTISTLLLIKNL